jgi:hypothetical protein
MRMIRALAPSESYMATCRAAKSSSPIRQGATLRRIGVLLCDDQDSTPRNEECCLMRSSLAKAIAIAAIQGYSYLA